MAKEKKSLIQEFKEFALQGNLFDMAVGVLIGGVFKDLVSAFTDNIIMPIISIFTGSVDFSSWRIALPSLFGDKIDPETGEVVVNYLNFGNFISAIITFLILAIVIFELVEAAHVNAAKPKGPEVEYSEDLEEKRLCYFNVSQIEPVYKIGYLGPQEPNSLVCKCYTPDGRVVWLSIKPDDYKTNFDATARFGYNASFQTISERTFVASPGPPNVSRKIEPIP